MAVIFFTALEGKKKKEIIPLKFELLRAFGWLAGWLVGWFIPVAPTWSIGNP
jgi:hypothetical protein